MNLQMRYTTTLLITLLAVYSVKISGQNNTTQHTLPSKPIPINKIALSGLELKPVKNKAQPNRKLFQSNLFLGKEIGVFVVGSETATANWKNYAIDEFIFVLNGRARLQPQGQSSLYFNKGDFFVAPKGYAGDWETQGGEAFYHELSVIALNREKTVTISAKEPAAIDKAKLDGIAISKDGGRYSDTLFKGVHITVTTHSEKPSTRSLNTIGDEQLIYVLSGKVSIIDTDNQAHTFYTNEFFVLPKGFSGTWKSEGHGLFRSLHVKKTK